MRIRRRGVRRRRAAVRARAAPAMTASESSSSVKSTVSGTLAITGVSAAPSLVGGCSAKKSSSGAFAGARRAPARLRSSMPDGSGSPTLVDGSGTAPALAAVFSRERRDRAEVALRGLRGVGGRCFAPGLVGELRRPALVCVLHAPKFAVAASSLGGGGVSVWPGCGGSAFERSRRSIELLFEHRRPASARHDFNELRLAYARL